MKFLLKRTDRNEDGVFGVLKDEQGHEVLRTLEHAYGDTKSGYSPKVPADEYTCKRSMHRLHGMDHDFETFQVMDVPGHSNILFHWGNYNKDSDGCFLVGKHATLGPNGPTMIINSRTTFARFMELLKGINEFTLKVENE